MPSFYLSSLYSLFNCEELMAGILAIRRPTSHTLFSLSQLSFSPESSPRVSSDADSGVTCDTLNNTLTTSVAKLILHFLSFVRSDSEGAYLSLGRLYCTLYTTCTYCIVLYCTVYCTVLYCTLLYCIVLCTVRFATVRAPVYYRTV
jgi:hypothetical protein